MTWLALQVEKQIKNTNHSEAPSLQRVVYTYRFSLLSSFCFVSVFAVFRWVHARIDDRPPPCRVFLSLGEVCVKLEGLKDSVMDLHCM